MTVWIVTLNGRPITVCGSKDRAGDVIESEKQRLSAQAGGAWRAVGGDAWSAPHVTSLARQEMAVQA